MNKIDVACEILKVEAHLSLMRAAMLQENMVEYRSQLLLVNRGITHIMDETLSFDGSTTMVTE